jgi:DNA-binding response OmpR family regulator
MDKKILIVDDEEQDRKGMAVALARAGLSQIAFADTGEKAVALAQEFRPDVTLVDVVIPPMDGFDVCRQIKALDGLNTIVIIITGHLEAVEVQKARTSGADEIIQKEPGFGNIIRTIERIEGEGSQS